MESNASHMDQAWRAKLYDHAVPPPPAAWENLSAAMAEEKPLPPPAASRAYSRYAASAVIALALLSGGWLNRDTPNYWTSISGEVSVAEQSKTTAMLAVPGFHTGNAHEHGTKELALVDQGKPAPHIAVAAPTQHKAPATAMETAELAMKSMPEAPRNDAPLAEPVAEKSHSATLLETAEVFPDQLTAAAQHGASDAHTGHSGQLTANPVGHGAAHQQTNPDATAFADPANSLLPAGDVGLQNIPSWAVEEAPNSVREGFYGGISAGMQLTALLSDRKATADVNLDPGTSLGHAYGFALGYRWNELWSAEANLLLDARQGAVYASTMTRQSEELEITKRVQLIYTQLPLTVRYGGLRSPVYAGERPRGGPATVVGLQYGLLRNSRLAVGDKSVSPDRTFARHDLALLLGADYDISVGQHGFFSVGLRGSLGLLRTRMTELDGVNSDKRNAVVGLRVAYNNWLSF